MQVILVGPPEYYYADKELTQLEPFNLPFREIEWCWGSLGYVNVLMYHLNGTKDIEGDSWVDHPGMKYTRTFYAARLHTEKLVPLLELALETVQAFGDTTWDQYQF